MGIKFIFQVVWRSKSITFSLPSNNSIKLMISIGLLAFPHPIYHLQLQNHFSLTSFTLTAGAGRNTFGMPIRHTTPIVGKLNWEIQLNHYTNPIYNEDKSIKIKSHQALSQSQCLHSIRHDSVDKNGSETAINFESVARRASQSPKTTQKIKAKFSCLSQVGATKIKLTKF